MKKKRMLAWLLALVFALTAPLPGIADKALAESQGSPPECTTHRPMEQAYDIPAGCTEPGYTNAIMCEDCGKILSYGEIIPPTGHSYGRWWSEWKPATCTEEGVIEWYCENPGCSERERYTLPPLGHVPVPYEERPASCLYEGHTEGTICSRCDKMLIEPEVVPALGHDFSKLYNEWGATCARAAGYRNCCSRQGCYEVSTEDNYIGEPHDIHIWQRTGSGVTEGGEYYQTWVCVICGKTHTGKTGPAGSEHILGYEDKYPTCTEDGYKDRLRCSCHKHVFSPGVTRPAWGHRWVEVVLDHPDCTNPGRAYKSCLCHEKTEEYELPATGHSWYDDYSTAKCTENGIRRCRYCYAIDDSVEVEPRGHDWVTIHTVPASGDLPGKEIQYCTRCGTRQDIVTGAAEGGGGGEGEGEGESGGGGEEQGHVCDFTEPYTIQQPTCTEPGLKGYKCKDCGNTGGTTEEIAPLGHQYERTTILEPKCLEYGKSVMKCTVCGAEDPATEERIDPPGHTWEERVIEEPTCAKKGWKQKFCTVCGRDGDLDLIDKLEHDWVQDEDKDPTCTEWGRLSGHCSVCGHTESLDLEPHGHDWIDVKTIREPNCKDPGVKLVRCRICNEEEEQAIPTNDLHDLTEEVFKEPTCTEWGKYRVYCKRCGREPVKGDKPPKGHTEVPVDDHKFNCLQGGMVGVTKCSVCGETINKGTWRSAIGHHNWAQKLIEPSTCQKKGSFRRYCTECPAEEIVELPLAEHTWVRGKIYREPDCFTEGWASTECLVCGAMGDPEIFPKTNKHKWITSPKKEPTCTKPGLTESIFCDVCGEYQKRAEIIPPIPHKEVIIHSMRPTSTLEGRTEGKRCGICGVWIVECKPLPKLASERTENNVTEQPPAWPKGSEEPASFKSDADIDDFSHVALNGDMVNESNYDLKEGSTIVIFKPEFLETLPEGKYDVEIVSISSSAFGTLEIVKAEGGYSIPKTGESTGYYLWLALMLLSAGKILLVLRKKKILGQSN